MGREEIEEENKMKQPLSLAVRKPTIIYDGVCNLCNAGLRFVASWDRDSKIQFASVQSASALQPAAFSHHARSRPHHRVSGGVTTLSPKHLLEDTNGLRCPTSQPISALSIRWPVAFIRFLLTRALPVMSSHSQAMGRMLLERESLTRGEAMDRFVFVPEDGSGERASRASEAAFQIASRMDPPFK